MKRWLLLGLFLLPSAHAAPAHEAALLEVRLDATMPLPLIDGRAVEANELPMVQPGENGCHDVGSIRREPAGNWFRFEETKQQSGCAELRIPVQLPSTANALTISFSADRRIEQAAQDSDQQLPSSAPQRVLFYGGDGSQTEASYFADNQPHTPQARPFTFTVPGAQLGRSFVVGWYFEDSGLGTSLATGTAIGRSLISDVRDLRLEAQGITLTPPTPQTDRQVASTDGEVEVHTIVADIEVPPGWLERAEGTLAISLLDSVEVRSVTRPDGQRLGSDDWAVLQSPGRQQLLLQDGALGEEGGTFRLEYEGTVSLASVAPAPPLRLPALVWGVIALVGVMYTAAVSHQALYARAASGTQRFTVARKNVELMFLGAVGIGLSMHVILFGFEDVAVMPISQRGGWLYLALGLVFLGSAVHLGIGVLRRQHVQEAARTRLIEATNRELARSNQDLERFAYVASHDLQEPIRKVQSFTGLLEKRYATQLDARASQYMQGANEAAVRARGLIGDLLAFSRIGTGDVPREDISLQATMAAVLEELAPALDEANATVQIDELPRLVGSEPLIRQLLTNLVGNAVKYRDPARAPHVQVRGRRHGNKIRIDVEDNGIGIAPDDQEKVFQLFQRLHAQTSAYRGSGIGLAICKRIVEFHGGRIWVTSAPGSGSTFSFEVPIR